MDDPVNDGDPVDEPINECWSCGGVFEDGDGRSLQGNGEEIICHACWERVPVWRRMWLGLWFRATADGGIGARDLLEGAVTQYWMPKPGRN